MVEIARKNGYDETTRSRNAQTSEINNSLNNLLNKSQIIRSIVC